MAIWRTQPSLPTLILAGLILGVATGLFLGELAAPLAVVGNAFVGLLQMTVLPYIAVSLIANIGRLEPREARRFGLYAGAFVMISLILTLATIMLLPMSLPDRESASFFSTSLLEERVEVDFLELFIPSNPFHSLANNIVPAVVLFCIAIGLALMTLPSKLAVLTPMDSFSAALARVNHHVVRLTPIGIFAIAASFSGTMQGEEFGRLKAYLVLYSVATALLGFGVLLPLLAALTPFSYRELFRAVRAPVMTAFVTGKVFVVLPMLIENAEGLFAKSHPKPDQPSSYAKAVAPLAYSFPHAGKLLALLFVPFAAWFVDERLGASDYPAFLGAGFFSMFGSPIAAMPFLLNMQRLPADLFELFLVSGVAASRLGDALGAIHLMFVTVLTASALSGGLRMRPRRLLGSLVAVAILGAVTTVGTRGILSRSLDSEYDRDRVIRSMHSSLHEAPAVVHRSVPEAALSTEEPVLERVARTGRLRVGYRPDVLPLSFFNAEGELVGYDVDMAQLFAGQLGASAEFIPFEEGTLAEQLERGDFDIAMSGVAMTPQNLTRMRFGEPHMHATLALVVRDHRDDEFRRRVEDRDFRGVTIAIVSGREQGSFGEGLFPGAAFSATDSPRAFFDSDGGGADAFIWSAESGSAWTLLYPTYSVVPVRPLFQVPIGYPVAKREEEFCNVVSRWVEVTQAGPLDGQLYDYWILGKKTRATRPRWSVVRDVLGWTD